MKYRISQIPNQVHWIRILFEFTPNQSGNQIICLPIWRPGRYQVQNFAKNIPHVKAFQGLKEIQISKIEISKWLLDIKNSQSVRIEYSYYANQRDAGGSVSNNELLYLNFINCLIFPEGWEDRKCELEIDFPSTWSTVTALKSQNGLWNAKTYRELVDSTFIAAPEINHFEWQIADCVFSIHGIIPSYIFTKKLKTAFQKFTNFQLNWMREFPVKEYHFFIWICEEPFYHGVEHTHSTMMVLGPEDRDCYDDLIGLASHELFHVWNIATIRPSQLFPYNYSQISYFDSGWIVEGITTYLGDWFLFASNVISEQEYLACLLGNLKLHFDRDEGAIQSLAESSMDLWLDGYGASIPGKRVSIYFKGAIVALAIDLMLRLKFKETKSLREVMNLMNARYGNLKGGYLMMDFYKIVEEVYQEPLVDFWKLWVEGNESIYDPLGYLLRSNGMEFYRNKEGVLHLEKVKSM